MPPQGRPILRPCGQFWRPGLQPPIHTTPEATITVQRAQWQPGFNDVCSVSHPFSARLLEVDMPVSNQLASSSLLVSNGSFAPLPGSREAASR